MTVSLFTTTTFCTLFTGYILLIIKINKSKEKIQYTLSNINKNDKELKEGRWCRIKIE